VVTSGVASAVPDGEAGAGTVPVGEGSTDVPAGVGLGDGLPHAARATAMSTESISTEGMDGAGSRTRFIGAIVGRSGRVALQP
jgi:hypothetical protein